MDTKTANRTKFHKRQKAKQKKLIRAYVDDHVHAILPNLIGGKYYGKIDKNYIEKYFTNVLPDNCQCGDDHKLINDGCVEAKNYIFGWKCLNYLGNGSKSRLDMTEKMINFKTVSFTSKKSENSIDPIITKNYLDYITNNPSMSSIKLPWQTDDYFRLKAQYLGHKKNINKHRRFLSGYYEFTDRYLSSRYYISYCRSLSGVKSVDEFYDRNEFLF